MKKNFPNASGAGSVLTTSCQLPAEHQRIRRNSQARYRRFAKKHGCSIEEAKRSITVLLETAMQD